MSKYAIVDKINFPLVVVSFTGEAANDENFSVYLKELRECYNAQQCLSIVFDASIAAVPALKYQKMQAQWLKDNKTLMEQFCAGTAYVLPNKIIRTVLKTIFSFQKQPAPYFICGEMIAAEKWARGQLLAQ